jgi:hypothetical protein
MRGSGRIVGVVLGAGAIAGAAAVFMHLRSRPASAATPSGSPRERSPSPAPVWQPPAAPVSPISPVSPVAPPALPGGSLYGHGGSYDPGYPPAIWYPIVDALIRTEYKRIDPRIAMKWLGMESDGAPCAFGEPGVTAPENGQPREIGLGQIYNPDDFKLLGLTARGITPSMFRAYCAPGSMRRTRALTPKEMEELVRSTLLAKIDHCMGIADHATFAHGLKWPVVDYWKLVKASHAWPPILNTGLPNVVKKLGRAPTSWSEFRQALGMDDERVRQKALAKQQLTDHEKLIWTWMRSLDNSEKLASVVADAGAV